jgi:hypothetical protein
MLTIQVFHKYNTAIQAEGEQQDTLLQRSKIFSTECQHDLWNFFSNTLMVSFYTQNTVNSYLDAEDY